MDMYQFYDIRTFMRRVNQEGVPFPTKRVYKTDKDVKLMMTKLSRFDYRSRINFDIDYGVRGLTLPLEYERNSVLLVNKRSDYEDFNILSDMFVEETRMKAMLFGRKHSPHSYFRAFPEKVAREAMRKVRIISPKSLTEALYTLPQVKECTSFRPGTMIALIQLLYGMDHGNIHVLDPSSGWGDRLIASIAAGVRYTGVDPNSAMVDRYADIIQFFDASEGRTMLAVPFEEVKLENEYDLVFTSPPYFDLESYSSEDTQSIKKFTRENVWTQQFLLPYVEKAWDAIKPGGFMAINIGQRQGQHYVEDMVAHINSLSAEYLGIIAHATEGLYVKAQPIFVWRKPFDTDIYAEEDLDGKQLSLRAMTVEDSAVFVASMKGKKTKSKKNNVRGLSKPCKLLSAYWGDELVGFIGYSSMESTTRNILRIRVIKHKGLVEDTLIRLFLIRFNYALVMAIAKANSPAVAMFEGLSVTHMPAKKLTIRGTSYMGYDLFA